MYVLNGKIKYEREGEREKMGGGQSHWKLVFLEAQPVRKVSLMLPFNMQCSVRNLDPKNTRKNSTSCLFPYKLRIKVSCTGPHENMTTCLYTLFSQYESTENFLKFSKCLCCVFCISL